MKTFLCAFLLLLGLAGVSGAEWAGTMTTPIITESDDAYKASNVPLPKCSDVNPGWTYCREDTAKPDRFCANGKGQQVACALYDNKGRDVKDCLAKMEAAMRAMEPYSAPSEDRTEANRDFYTSTSIHIWWLASREPRTEEEKGYKIMQDHDNARRHQRFIDTQRLWSDTKAQCWGKP
jgi:hypothetical protein